MENYVLISREKVSCVVINGDYDTYGCCFRSNSCILAIKAMTWSDSYAIVH